MLVQSAYGKSRVRLVQVRRQGDRHAVRDLTVAIQFRGAYDESYTDGDNSSVLPTDTMKNTVYALAAQEPVTDPEPFALRLARHFLERNPRLSRATIEITEHAAVHPTGPGAQTAQELRTLGVELALDDFGAGFSSLSTLRALPVQTLKLDRGIVAGLGVDAADTGIVSGVLRADTEPEGVPLELADRSSGF